MDVVVVVEGDFMHAAGMDGSDAALTESSGLGVVDTLTLSLCVVLLALRGILILTHLGEFLLTLLPLGRVILLALHGVCQRALLCCSLRDLRMALGISENLPRDAALRASDL